MTAVSRDHYGRALAEPPTTAQRADLAGLLGDSLSLDLLVSVIDTLPVGVAVLDASPEFRFVHCNPMFERWTPVEDLPLKGKPMGRLRGVEQNRILDVLSETVSTGRPQHLRDFQFVGYPNATFTLPGDVTVWNWDLYPITDAGGAVTHLLSVGTDVTEQAISRRALVSAHEDVFQALLEMSRHIENAPDMATFFGRLSETVSRVVGARRAAFYLLQDDGTVSAQRHAHGFTDEQVSSMRQIPCTADGGDLAGSVVFHDRVFRGSLDGHPELAAYRAFIDALGVRDALSVPWRSGDRRLGALSVFDSTSPDGFGEGAVWILKITALAAGLVWQHQEAQNRLDQLRRAEVAELRGHGERIQELEKVKSQFLNLAAHELRGPVTVLQGYLSMLDDGSLGGVEGRAREALPIMLARSNHINRLIDDMLDAARLEDGRLELEPELIDLGTAAMVVVQTVGPLATPLHGLRLIEPSTPVIVRGDRNRIHSMLADLVENAIKYSPDGGEIECVVSSDGAVASVAVRDHGLGIAEAEMGRLFTRFGRTVTRETSHIPGSGLGLYLARELARLHGGDVQVVSTPGVGSTFTLSLPLAATPEG
ncbi:MAG: ATP-binding protein [Candidatus Dormibacteria bacterium]